MPQVKILNIIAIGKKGEWEERKADNTINLQETNDPLPRLVKHLQFCADYAVKIHSSLNHNECEIITRLTMSEFSCYTSNQPLSFEQYKSLITAINLIATTLPANIHLILGTFAVKWKNGNIHNTALHIQSPTRSQKQPLIHHFDKQTPFYTDPKYFDSNNNTYQIYRLFTSEDYYLTEYSPDKALADTKVSCHDPKQYRSAIKITTDQQQEFLVAIDICADHENQIALDNLIKLKSQLHQANEEIPQIGCHIIMSNSVHAHRDSLISRSLLHADHNAISHTKKKEIIPNPHFGKELWLITCDLQPILPIDNDNIYFYKTNFDYYLEHPRATSIYHSATLNNQFSITNSAISSDVINETKDDSCMQKISPPIIAKTSYDLLKLEEGVKHWFLQRYIFLKKEYRDGSIVKNDLPPLPLEIIYHISTFVTGLTQKEVHRIFETINHKLVIAPSRDSSNKHSLNLFSVKNLTAESAVSKKATPANLGYKL